MAAIRRVLAACVLGFLLAGCQEDGGETSGADAQLPDILSPQRTACEKSGGRWGGVPGRDAFVCYKTTRDANAPCATESDCEGLCLARSRTCAPVTPFFGCHEVIASSGLRQTRCVE